jgi:hypothetical protein
MWLSSVVPWVDILAAGEDESLNAIENGACQSSTEWRSGKRNEASARERVHIRGIDTHAKLAANDFGGCCDSDDR